MSTTLSEQKKVTTLSFKQKKQRGIPLTVVTAYDYSSAMLVDKAGMDCILVGDSLGMVVLGYDNTLAVTMDDMLHHCRAVRRGASRPLLVADMPFMSYQVSVTDALRNAGRLLQEAGMDAVKLEGGAPRVETIQHMIQSGIPVMGHLGLTPQSINQLGGFRSQGNKASSARLILEDALRLEDAGCFAIVLESIPTRLAELISRRLSIPTIGIGAGNGCDGQVLVFHDILGLFDRLKPRFVKTFANLGEISINALAEFKNEVETRQFPGSENSFDMSDDEWNSLTGSLF
ncbi:MAG: 3-methyl-2-oxobutanoate hydroxymethyltransferase [Anaerolineae bacterium]|nr:3-methyl-2-oxobutanoate hydroxymethyltransferase [Anaerolineae bacterium]